jgi:hypothetical protein
MPQYMIERSISDSSPEQWKDASRRESNAADGLSDVTWLRSKISATEGKLYSYLEAPNEAALHEHARRAGLPVGKIMEVAFEVKNDRPAPPKEAQRYLVERTLPPLTDEQWNVTRANVIRVADELPGVSWIKCSVAEASGKVYCEFSAPNPESLREHAVRAGIPVDRVIAVDMDTDPEMFR